MRYELKAARERKQQLSQEAEKEITGVSLEEEEHGIMGRINTGPEGA
jgi:hypothetical protein